MARSSKIYPLNYHLKFYFKETDFKNYTSTKFSLLNHFHQFIKNIKDFYFPNEDFYDQ